MKIVDLTAGNRAIWFNKKHPEVLYIDKRAECEPDIVADTKSLEAVIEDGAVDLIVYDPPHMNCGPNSNMSKTYGYHTTEEILRDIAGSGKEAHRITKPEALMALKWNSHDIKLSRVFELLPQWEPLFGHLTKDGPRSQTYWCLLRRRK